MDDEKHWPKILIMFNSIEAAAFAAVGALVGVQVKRAEAAANGEKKAKADLHQEKKINEIGEDLAHKVLSEKGDALDLGVTMTLNLDKTRSSSDTSVDLAKHFLAVRRAANRAT
jgi:hypothetical protein